jgi:hypothetical protein
VWQYLSYHLKIMTVKLNIVDMRETAAERGGDCLSIVYLNAKAKLTWQCSKGHVWEATPNGIRNGRWCPICGVKKRGDALRLDIQNAKAIADGRGGLCISTEYVDAHAKLTWQCAEGHIWNASYSNTKKGHWCPVCSYEYRGDLHRKTIDDIRAIAKEHLGECLSTDGDYKTAHSVLRFHCAVGHVWDATATEVRSGTWCRVCSNARTHEAQRLSIDLVVEKAIKRGGEVLSSEYKNRHSHLIFKCKYGHIWEAPFSSVQRGAWCPICSAGSNETVCRFLFEKLFSTPFPKARPDWLIGPSGARMELDGYAESLHMAFEYNGIQHYQEVEFFSSRSLEKQRLFDNAKAKSCLEHGSMLIVIPYTIDIYDMERFIRSEAKILGVPILRRNKVDVTKAPLFREAALDEMQQIAAERGGLCLSEGYINAITKMDFECEIGHRWMARPNNIKSGRWCPQCAGRKPH